jgi:hypothetical protein
MKTSFMLLFLLTSYCTFAQVKVIPDMALIPGGSFSMGKTVEGLPANWVDFAVGFRCVKDLVK